MTDVQIYRGRPVSSITGPRWQVIAEVRRLENRGEIEPLRLSATVTRAGTMTMPFVRLKPAPRRGIRWSVGVASALAVMVAAAWMLYEIRYILLWTVLGATLLAGLVLWGPHWKRGCSGLHCTGCRG